MSSKKKTSKTSRLALLNGPNLNLLGERNKEIYGAKTLPEIEKELVSRAEAQGFELECFQSNSEGELIDRIHALRTEAAGLLINPGAYSHTSIALRDALECFPGPIIEVHLSNIHKREPFRHHSYVSEVASGVICGLGPQGYEFGLSALIKLIN